ncbi:hypothetical protein TWF694_002373 [Orbilia ellipsospora]|uniref:protein disulfide-isomerase n=1 Tax=Orbilia ellipsospora TaxID=2528407 RepID=A0AAV9X301_9PEZI
MKFLSTASVLFYAVLAVAEVVDLTPKNFDDVVLKSGKPSLVKFFAPWCGHCKKLAPAYDELGTAFTSVKDKVTIAKVDGDAHKALAQRFGIKGYPTLKWFDGKSDKPIDYDSGRTLEAMTKYVTDKSGIKPKGSKKEPEKFVKVLTDANFGSITGDPSKNVLVKFYAPWCGHCKSLAPIYEKIASDFSREPRVTIAEIDCDIPSGKESCDKHAIKSFPTLKFFAADDSPEITGAIDYEGPRDQDSIMEWMNQMSSTHRKPGGQLGADAGTIEILDDIIKEHLPSGGASILAEIEGALSKLEKTQEKHAKVYLNVAKKFAAKSSTYITDELARLGKMIAGGKVNLDKVDELTIKQNILKRFQSTPDDKEEAKSVEEEAPKKDEL